MSSRWLAAPTSSIVAFPLLHTLQSDKKALLQELTIEKFPL
jgi:hypothetical protein